MIDRRIRHTWIDLYSAIYGRRATRRYLRREVARSLIEKLIDAAIQAPSAMDREPWAFVVIQGAARLAEISQMLRDDLRVDDSNANVFFGAPALVIICATATDQQSAEDCSLAAQNFMLAAYANNLGTCPLGIAREWLASPKTKRALGIPPELTPVFPMTVGYSDERPQSHGRNAARILWVLNRRRSLGSASR